MDEPGLDGPGRQRAGRLSQAEFDEYQDNGGSEIFARSGETYFAITYATDVRYYTVEDAEPFHNAFNAIRDFAEKTVLETEGVEPYSPGLAKDTLQSRLEDIPEDLRGEVALHSRSIPLTWRFTCWTIPLTRSGKAGC